MNKSYALVWNATQGCWQVASELTRRRGKAGRGRVLMTAGASLIGLAFAGLAHALPTGGAVVDGKGTIQAEGQQMIVDQQSHKLITNWESFNVGAQEGVTFRQPDQNAIALNRVIGNEGSSILGRIDANGQVFLVNPNGVLFGQGAQVNVGSLVASTLDIGNEDFKADRYVFSGDSAAHVVNAGAITAATGGAVELMGRKSATRARSRPRRPRWPGRRLERSPALRQWQPRLPAGRSRRDGRAGSQQRFDPGR